MTRRCSVNCETLRCSVTNLRIECFDGWGHISACYICILDCAQHITSFVVALVPIFQRLHNSRIIRTVNYLIIIIIGMQFSSAKWHCTIWKFSNAQHNEFRLIWYSGQFIWQVFPKRTKLKWAIRIFFFKFSFQICWRRGLISKTLLSLPFFNKFFGHRRCVICPKAALKTEFNTRTYHTVVIFAS